MNYYCDRVKLTPTSPITLSTMSASSSKLNSLTDTVKENVLTPRNINVMVPKEENNYKGRDDLSQGKKKACHQCRQKTANFSGYCKKNRKKGPCPISYCATCLLNRYGEQEEVAQMEVCWICPKCRGICNCSCCRKKRGQMPTGMLTQVAKASGCSSVHDLLQKRSEAMAAAHVDGSLKRVSKRANNFQHEGADLITLLPPVPTKKRTKLSYTVNIKWAPSPRAQDNLNALHTPKVTPSGSQVTSNAGAQVGDDAYQLVGAGAQVGEDANPQMIKAAAPRFRLFGVPIP